MKKQQEDGKLVRVRTYVLLALFAAVLCGFFFILYDVQYVNGQTYLDSANHSVARTESVSAARGELLDSYGRVLVSNETAYQVTLDVTLMGTKAERYATLAALLALCRSQGIDWADSLPVSTSAPYVYTLNSASSGELSRLRSLTTLYKWDEWTCTVVPEDAAQAPQPAPDQAPALTREELLEAMGQSGAAGRAHGLDALPARETWSHVPAAAGRPDGDAQGVKVWTPNLAAPELMAKLRAEYRLDELAPGLSEGEARDLLGVLYELDLRQRELTYTEYVFATGVDITFITLVKEARLAGVSIEAVSTRRYHTTSAAHILGRVAAITTEQWAGTESSPGYRDLEGYAYNDRVGQEGVESAFERYLHGVSGTRAIETDSTGKIISESWITEPAPGNNVALTLDLQLQTAVEEALARHIEGLEETTVGAAVMVDMTGGVLAMASYPTYDLSTYSQNFKTLNSDPSKPLYNRATQGTYMPGSIFKMVTGLAGLQEGVITPTSQTRDQGVFTYYTSDRKLAPKCWIFRQYGSTHGMETVTTAIRDSCNYFFYDVASKLGIDTLGRYANMLGLGRPTGIEIPEETGYVAGPETSSILGTQWYEGATTSAAIGQENNLFTPLQLANYIATLVNGGTHYAAHLLKSVKSADYSELVYEYQPQVLDEIDISPANLEALKSGMYLVTQTASVARYFNALPVKAGAKTGTAQVSNNTSTNATFVCFAPYDDPQVALCLVVEKGSSGASLAALAAEILQYYFSTEETLSAVSGENTLLR